MYHTNNIGSKDNECLRDINNTIEALVKSRYFIDDQIDSRIQGLITGSNSIPKRLRYIKNNTQNFPEINGSSGLITNELINCIDPAYTRSTIDILLPDFISFKINKTSDSNLENRLIEAWGDLLNSENSELREFAEDLVDYAFLTSGGNFSRNSIFNYVPQLYKGTHIHLNMSYDDFIRNAEKSITFTPIDIDNIFKHLWWNDKIVPTVSLFFYCCDLETYRRIKVPIPGIWTNYLDKSIKEPYPLLFTNQTIEQSKALNRDNKPIYPPFVKAKVGRSSDPANVMLYRFVGVDAQMKPIYKITNKLGLNYRGNMFFEGKGKPEIKECEINGVMKNISYHRSYIALNNPKGSNSRVVDILREACSDDIQRSNPYFTTLLNWYMLENNRNMWFYCDLWPKDLNDLCRVTY